MKFSIITLFPEMFADPLGVSILGRGQRAGLIEVVLTSLRDFGTGRHRQVDDASFGGGPGMVIKPDVMDAALKTANPDGSGYVVYLSPQGACFDQERAVKLASLDHLVLICGHYEGLDERFIQSRVDEEISLGDFVLTGGEIPAMAVVDATARMIPGVLGDSASYAEDSFYDGMLDHPHYTRPAEWSDQVVPDVLLSGNHAAIAAWRRRQSLLRTLIRRPDILKNARLTRHEKRLIQALAEELDLLNDDINAVG
ncbi:MAG: tRNA (guanosine(37)-N1)-methyltransferase TrmD [Magnetococcales bacterium]|nr:tRNA (guanosine(37)-N1)-methyltransferase TrmD [Magnetococcales bacterium]